MGKVLSVITKPVREFNIESRAHKVISKQKPIPAPKHKPDEAHYEELLKEQPEAFKKALEKDEMLDKRLKDVFLRSHDPLVKHEPQGTTNPDRPLPVARTFADTGEYGFYEPNRVPYGRVTLRKALRFISEHHTDHETFTKSKISEQYLLPEDVVVNVLKYYKMYEMYIPQQRNVKAKFAGPAISRTKIKTERPKLLDYEKEEKDIFKK